MKCNLTDSDRKNGIFCRSFECQKCKEYKTSQYKSKFCSPLRHVLQREVYPFSYSLGHVLGCLSNEEIRNFLEQKGVSPQEIHDIKDSINKLSRVFYQA